MRTCVYEEAEMKFSKKSRYGLTALIDLAVYSKEDRVALGSIAERNHISVQYLEQIFDARPEMHQISSNHSERHSILRPFAITPIAGSIYDLRQQPIFQKRIEF